MMTVLDSYVFYIFVFSPLIASIFITLIPTIDTGSKLAISRFFALVGCVAFARIFFIFLDHNIQTETALTFNFANFNIHLILVLTKYNVLLYGATAVALTVNMFVFEINDTKTNIHHVAPFVLTFILYVCFGQTDLRVALPILSIANFLVYFLIGATDKIRRGSTIFQMGIFLFSCDALALVLLQIPFFELATTTSQGLLTGLLLIPGFARLGLPMLAPFMKKLLLNVDDIEGPFLITFLQLAGFALLILVKIELNSLSVPLIIAIATIAIIGAIYIALVAITDHKIRNLPYYFLTFYSSLAALVLFLSMERDFWNFSLSLMLTNIACFFHTTRFVTLVNQNRLQDFDQAKLRSSWFISLSMYIGLPGFGMGASLWAIIYRFMTSGFLEENYPWSGFFRLVAFAWLFGFLLLSFALILSVREDVTRWTGLDTIFKKPLPSKRSLVIAPVAVGLLSWLIPMITFYTASKTP